MYFGKIFISRFDLNERDRILFSMLLISSEMKLSERLRVNVRISVLVFNATFKNIISYIMAVRFIGGGNTGNMSKLSTSR